MLFTSAANVFFKDEKCLLTFLCCRCMTMKKMCYLLFCFINSFAFVVGWLAIIIVTFKVLFGPASFQQLRDKAFAALLAFVMKDVFKEALWDTMTELFSSMGRLKSFEPELSKKNALKILEVGYWGLFSIDELKDLNCPQGIISQGGNISQFSPINMQLHKKFMDWLMSSSINSRTSSCDEYNDTE